MLWSVGTMNCGCDEISLSYSNIYSIPEPKWYISKHIHASFLNQFPLTPHNPQGICPHHSKRNACDCEDYNIKLLQII